MFFTPTRHLASKAASVRPQSAPRPVSLQWGSITPQQYLARQRRRILRVHPHPMTLPRAPDADTIAPNPDLPSTSSHQLSVPRVFFVQQLFKTNRADAHVHTALTLLGLGAVGKHTCVPDIPTVRDRLWRVRHLIWTQPVDCDDVRRMYEWPLHPLSIPHGMVYTTVRSTFRHQVLSELNTGTANAANWLPSTSTRRELDAHPTRLSPRAVPTVLRGPRSNPPAQLGDRSTAVRDLPDFAHSEKQGARYFTDDWRFARTSDEGRGNHAAAYGAFGSDTEAVQWGTSAASESAAHAFPSGVSGGPADWHRSGCGAETTGTDTGGAADAGRRKSTKKRR
eukprot:TRINITY_DN21683_c0_g1_i1.p1 TRINITY_DN21683_c0_g1~~TRINITY_DN21683_c0_g1_i1.p1  ORF type:complete len:337 (+),score=42.53 TRINITY_DN21683_c0_g1_i1:197-1207(+)